MMGPLLTLGSTLLSGAMAARRQEDAQDFSADQFSRKHQIETADLKAAGLNPMLGYMKGGGTPPSSSAASAASHDVGASYLQSKLNSAQVANVEAQTAKTQAETRVIETAGVPTALATLDNLLAQNGLTQAQISNVEQMTKVAIEQVNKAPYERDQLKAAAYQLHKLGGLQELQGLSEPERKRYLQNQANLLVEQTSLAKFDVEAASNLGNIGREAGQLKPLVQMLLEAIKSRR